MNDSSFPAQQKWKCEYCTYQNYQSSLKCTMCKGQKPLLNEDIYRLSPTQQSQSYRRPSSPQLLIDSSSQLSLSQSNLQNACGPSTQDALKSKWSCPQCTYLNWPRAQRCNACCIKRETVDNSNQQQHQQRNVEQMKALTIRGSDPDLSQQPNQQQKQQRTSPIGSVGNATVTRQQQTAPLGAGARTSPVDQQPAQQQQPRLPSNAKWRCAICTYENWPKSMKCSMCLTSKDAIPPQDGAIVRHNQHSNTTSPNSPVIHSSPERDRDNELIETSNCASNIICCNNNATNKQQQQQQRNLISLHRSSYQSLVGCSEPQNNCDLRQLRKKADLRWLNACIGVVENNFSPVEAYLSCGGNPGRSLTSSEVSILNRNSAFDVGHTLIHLAIRFHREEMLPMLLAQINCPGPGIKRVPSYVAPDLASDIRRHFANSLRIRKTSPFSCHYAHEHATFSLPAEIEELPLAIQEQLYDELLDRDAQKQLENPPPALNWSLEVTARLGSRLMVLWNRSAGDCLLDSAMQATWGVFDRDNTLRRALSDSLHQCGHIFYPRWKEYEMLQAAMLNYSLEETQWEDDWTTLLSLASHPGSSLEQLHIFALAHILRRPIIVYGVKYVKSFRGEDIGYARFEGLYLPLFWEQSFCIKSPIALGYTRGHFSALVPTESYSRIDAARDESEDITFLPLMDCDNKLLPIHFLTQSEMGREESIMRQWLDVCMTEGGLLVAQQKLHKRPLLVAQMLEEWLNHYRRIAQVISAPFTRRLQMTGYSSDGDSDEE